MSTSRNARKEYIVAKYAERRYVLRREEADPGWLYDAVRSHELASLLQLYAEGADISKPLATPDGQVRIIYGRQWDSAPAFLPQGSPVGLCGKSPETLLSFIPPEGGGRPPGLFAVAPYAFMSFQDGNGLK